MHQSFSLWSRKVLICTQKSGKTSVLRSVIQPEGYGFQRRLPSFHRGPRLLTVSSSRQSRLRFAPAGLRLSWCVRAYQVNAHIKQTVSAVATTLLQQKAVIALASLGTLLIGAALFLESHLAPLLSDPTGVLALRSIAASVLFLCVSVCSYFWFRPRLKLNEIGIYENLKTGEIFCPKCKHDKKQLVHAIRSDKSWLCVSCDSDALKNMTREDIKWRRGNYI